MPDGAYEIKNDVRKISSVVLREEYIDKLPEPTTKHVEVAPYVDEVIKYVVKKETREVEKIVPKYVAENTPKAVKQQVDVKHKSVNLISKKVENEVIQVPKTVEVVKQIPVTKYEKKSQKLIVA